MPFHGDVVVTPIEPSGTSWKLVQPFDYQGRFDRFTVPAEFETDFASVPRVFVWLLPRYGVWTRAAILHDYLWSLARMPAGERVIDKFDADGMFVRAMRELGVPFLRRWVMWAAVRWAAGPRTWFERGPVPFLKMLAITIPAIVFVAAPVVVIVATLVAGFVAEWIMYVPLRLFHRDKRKDVNPPDGGDVLVTA
jgi:Protein of unknown function (DUF1353)